MNLVGYPDEQVERTPCPIQGARPNIQPWDGARE